MSTSATIAYRLPDGDRWKGVYQHCDGMDMAAEVRKVVEHKGAAYMRRLIDETPQGFSAFTANNVILRQRDGRDNEPTGRYRKGEQDTTEYGRGLLMSRHRDYTVIVERDGSVTELGRGAWRMTAEQELADRAREVADAARALMDSDPAWSIEMAIIDAGAELGYRDFETLSAAAHLLVAEGAA